MYKRQPGHMDFIAEVERTFKMLDGAVLILSVKQGIQAQTKLLFSTLQKLQIPTIISINKIDRAGVNLERLYMDIKTNLSQEDVYKRQELHRLIRENSKDETEYKRFVDSLKASVLTAFSVSYTHLGAARRGVRAGNRKVAPYRTDAGSQR